VFGVSERSCTQILTVCFKKVIHQNGRQNDRGWAKKNGKTK
jgi:hypothetical protein